MAAHQLREVLLRQPRLLRQPYERAAGVVQLKPDVVREPIVDLRSRDLLTIDHYLAGDATWHEFERAVRHIYLGVQAYRHSEPDEAELLADMVVAIERLGKLLIYTDDDYLGAALHDAAVCLGWPDVAMAIADALDRPVAVDVLVALLPHAETPIPVIEAAQLLRNGAAAAVDP